MVEAEDQKYFRYNCAGIHYLPILWYPYPCVYSYCQLCLRCFFNNAFGNTLESKCSYCSYKAWKDEDNLIIIHQNNCAINDAACERCFVYVKDTRDVLCEVCCTELVGRSIYLEIFKGEEISKEIFSDIL